MTAFARVRVELVALFDEQHTGVNGRGLHFELLHLPVLQVVDMAQRVANLIVRVAEQVLARTIASKLQCIHAKRSIYNGTT